MASAWRQASLATNWILPIAHKQTYPEPQLRSLLVLKQDSRYSKHDADMRDVLSINKALFQLHVSKDGLE